MNTYGKTGGGGGSRPSDPGCWGAKLSLNGGTFQGSWSLDGFAADQKKLFEIYLQGGGLFPSQMRIGTLLVNGDYIAPSLNLSAPSSLPNPTSRAYICGPAAAAIQQLLLQNASAKQLAPFQAVFNKSCH
jgi:hypothetical protein